MKRTKRQETLALVILILAALLLRLPAMVQADEYTVTDPDSYLYIRRSVEFSRMKLTEMPMYSDRFGDPLMQNQDAASTGKIPNGFPILGAVILKICSLFGQVSPEKALACFSSLLQVLIAILVFLYVCRRTNVWGGLSAGMCASVIPVLFGNSLANNFDTNLTVQLLTACVMLMLAEAFCTRKFCSQIIRCAASASFLVLLSFCWTAYQIVYALALATVPGLLIFWPKNSKTEKMICLRGALLTAAMMTAALYLIHGSELFTGITGLTGALGDVLSTNEGAYPDAMRFVAELRKKAWVNGSFPGNMTAGYDSIVSLLGGVLPILLAAAAFVLLNVFCVKQTAADQCLREGKEAFPCAAVMLPWSICTILMTYVGTRFTEFAAVPVSILCGLSVGFITAKMSVSSRHETTISAVWIMCVFAACVACSVFGLMPTLICGLLLTGTCLLLRKHEKTVLSILLCVCITLSPVLRGISAVSGKMSRIGNGAAEAMKWARDNTPEDSVMATWWDNGYYIQYAAQRKTPADGGTLNNRFFYWLAKAMMTDDSGLSAGIIRMLNNQGTEAVLLLEKHYDPESASELLCSVLPLSREEAEAYLNSEGMTGEETAELLAMTHPIEQHPVYLILTDDLFDKIHALIYYGMWNFSDNERSANVLMSSKISNRIADGECSFDIDGVFNARVVFEDGVPVNVFLQSTSGSHYLISNCIMVRDGKVISDMDMNENGMTVYVVEEGNERQILVCSEEIADSLLVRLFFTDTDEGGVYRLAFCSNEKAFGETTHGIKIWEVIE